MATKIAAEQGWELAQVRLYTGIADAKRDPFWHHLTAGKDSSQNSGGCFASCTIADYLSDSTSRKAPFFKKSEIQGEVDAFCAKYKIDQQQVPLDVELIVEADLRLELRPEANLFKRTEMDALLTSNRKTIMVDLDRFTKKNLQSRLRFTIAHEIGHYVLHEAIYKDVKFGSVEDWLDFFENFPQIEYRKFRPPDLTEFALRGNLAEEL